MTPPDARESPSDPPLRSVQLAAGPASYTDEGHGPAVLAVHGLPGSARDFRWLAPHVTPAARMIRLELPGFGATPVETEPDPSPAGRARFLLSFLDALGVERPLLVGHSMGGVTACAAADLRPEAFRGLALLASPGMRRHSMLRRYPLRALDALLSRPLLGRAMAGINRRVFALVGFRRYPDAELYRTVKCAAATSIPEHAERLRRLKLPTLVAWCDDDGFIEPDISEELAAVCPDGPRLRFAKGGHNLQKSHAAEIGEAITAWLGETGPAACERSPRDADRGRG